MHARYSVGTNRARMNCVLAYARRSFLDSRIQRRMADSTRLAAGIRLGSEIDCIRPKRALDQQIGRQRCHSKRLSATTNRNTSRSLTEEGEAAATSRVGSMRYKDVIDSNRCVHRVKLKKTRCSGDGPRKSPIIEQALDRNASGLALRVPFWGGEHDLSQ